MQQQDLRLAALRRFALAITVLTILGHSFLGFELYVLFGGLYMTFGVLLPAIFRGRKDTFLTFLGFFVLTGTAINDVLSNMAIINMCFPGTWSVY